MRRLLPILIALLSIALGTFFIYKGITKHFLSPCKVYAADDTIPLEYRQVITAFCHSGYTKVVGFFQVLSGILLLVPKTRLLGTIVLLPIIFNIFLLHLTLDNRPEELIETGFPLLATILILVFYFPKWQKVLFK